MSKSKQNKPTRVKRHWRGFSLYGLFASLLLILTTGVAAAVLLYGLELDQVVREKFEGKRWALPARVYAQPLELYVGRPLSEAQLLGELDRLGYDASEDLDFPGTYRPLGEGRFQIRTRPFRFWDGSEPARDVQVALADGRIKELVRSEESQPISLIRLDPALIASIYPAHLEDRALLTRSQIPNLLIKTLLAVEDKTFYEHFGVDPSAIARAAYQNLMAGRTVQGASTLTQQLVKNFYLTKVQTIERKLNEAYMAVLLERRYSKDEILTAYANEVYLGQDGSRAIHGFGLASHFYFDRDLRELNIPETALLVGILKGPSQYNPRRHPERALARRNLVIDLMVYHQVISPEEAEAAKAAPLGIRESGGRPSGSYPAFIELVRQQLQRDYRDEDLRSEGLKIFTTLDPLVQDAVEVSIRERLPQLDERRGFEPGTLETAAVVTSVVQGEVLALVGGRETDYQGFNRALDGVRNIGSLAKPAVYLAALLTPERYSLVTPIFDEEVSLVAGNGTLWEPQNYDGQTHGVLPLYQGLVHSYNLATVNLGLELGVETVADTLRLLGVSRRIDAVPAIFLGSVSLPPIEVAQIYQTIAAGGFRVPLRTIREVLDANGRPLTRYPLSVEAALSDRAIYLLQWALRQVVEQGTGMWLKQKLPGDLIVAGKTGTTNGQRDSWFAGFSGDKVMVTWIGRDDNEPTGLTGSSGALRLWGDIMARLQTQSLDFQAPQSIQMVEACAEIEQPIPFIDGLFDDCVLMHEALMAQQERELAESAMLDESVIGDPSRNPFSEAAPREDRRPSNDFLSDFFSN